MKRYGSSPRTWGTLLFYSDDFLVCRFIPTYMGNAPKSAFLCSNPPVHPHVHGEREDYRS